MKPILSSNNYLTLLGKSANGGKMTANSVDLLADWVPRAIDV